MAASSAAVAAGCFLIAPVMSSMLLSSSAMQSASRSRSTQRAHLCRQELRFGLRLGDTRRHSSDCARVVRGEYHRRRSLADSVLLVIARIFSATAVRPSQPHSHKSELGSRLRLRGFRGRLLDRHGSSMDDSLKTLAESGKSRCHPGSKVFCRWAD